MIAVLAPDLSEELLTEIVGEVTRRSWTCEASRGREQTVLAVCGPQSAEELEELLATRAEGDVITLRTRREYDRQRLRRRLMHGMALGLTLLLAFGLGIPVLGFLHPPDAVLVAPDVVRAGLADEIPENSAKLVRLDDTPILLVRLVGGRFFAVAALCTYTGDCQLEWSKERLQIVCPCHGCVHDVYGNVIEGPASIPQASYRVDRFGDNIFVGRKG